MKKASILTVMTLIIAAITFTGCEKNPRAESE